MDVPIALALAVGYGRGAYNTIQDSGPIYFDGVATLIFLLLVGRFLQQRAQRAATDSSELLFSLAPATARVVVDGRVEEVPSVAVLPGALLDVRTGDTLAADGTVVRGESTLDLALLTGESRPVSARIGTEVFAGTTNLSAPIQVRVTSAGESSRLGRILKDVEDSARRRAPIVRLADRMASLFITVVLVLATAAWWYGMRTDPAHALDNAIAMLIVTCPCALALATPLAVTVAIGRAARQGILIKGGDALEALSRPGLLILDKTGTITEGRMALDEWIGPANLKPLIAALEKHSRHPVAAAFVRAWETDEMVTVTDVTETLGGGIRGKVNGHELAIGTPIWIAQSAREAAVPFAPLGAALTPAVVAVDGQIVGRAGFGDPLRPDAIAAIRELKSRGWKVSILSGDDPAVVTAAAHTLGLNAAECRGAATPEEKRAIVERAAKEGPVVMVGDGVNDAAAIAAATVGIGVRRRGGLSCGGGCLSCEKWTDATARTRARRAADRRAHSPRHRIFNRLQHSRSGARLHRADGSADRGDRNAAEFTDCGVGRVARPDVHRSQYMSVLYLLIPLALVLVIVFVAAYVWSSRTGQFDDLTTPALRVLLDDQPRSTVPTPPPNPEVPRT